MDRRYYACAVRFNENDTFVIWYQNEHDGFVRCQDGRLLHARSAVELANIAAELGLELVPEEPAQYDLDLLQQWTNTTQVTSVDCDVFLNAWNFFDDLAGLHNDPDTEYAMLSRSALHLYDRLFWGNKLPSITPVGEHFTPSWSEEDLKAVRLVFEAGLRLFRSALTSVGSPPT